MRELGFENSDEFLQALVQNFPAAGVYDYDDLDEETRAAIEEAEKQPSIPWESVREQLMQRYGGK
jgi:hypothetical protein